MLQVRLAAERGHFNHDWLDTYHTFSFGEYHDPDQMGFRVLRVMNEDRIAPGQGFGMHGHRDMEIVTYVLQGELQHQDSLGNGSILRPGEFQRMSAGTGVRHSEFNPSDDQPVHLYQIWLLPHTRGLTPGYEQQAFSVADQHNRFQLVAAPDGAEGALTINQDARIYLAQLEPNESLQHGLSKDRHAWLQVLTGAVSVNGIILHGSDGLAISDVQELGIKAATTAELMLFDLP